MGKIRKTAVMMVIFLLAPPAIFADPAGDSMPFVMGYAEALERLRSDNNDMKAARLNERMSENAATGSVVSSFVPSLSASSSLATGRMYPSSASPMNEWEWVGNEYVEYPDIAVTATLSLGSTTVTNAILSGIQKSLARFTYEQTAANLENALWSAYWGLSLLDKAVEAGQRSLDAADAALANAKARFDAGIISSLEYGNSRLARANAERSLLSLKQERESAYFSLKMLLNYKGDEFVTEEFAGHVRVDLPDADVLYGRYLTSNSTLKSLRIAKDLASATATATDLAARLPRVTASLSYGYRGRYASQYQTDILSLSISASMSLDGFVPYTSAYNSIKEAHERASIAQLNLEAGYDDYRLELEKDIRNLGILESSCVAAREQADYAAEVLRLSQEAFQNGQTTAQSHSDAMNSALQSELAFLQAEFNYQNAARSLSSYLGEEYGIFMARYGVVEPVRGA